MCIVGNLLILWFGKVLLGLLIVSKCLILYVFVVFRIGSELLINKVWWVLNFICVCNFFYSSWDFLVMLNLWVEMRLLICVLSWVCFIFSVKLFGCVLVINIICLFELWSVLRNGMVLLWRVSKCVSLCFSGINLFFKFILRDLV